MNLWRDTKLWLATDTGLPDSTLHVLGGMLLLILGALMLRRLPWNWRPWLMVLGLELANEAYDLLNHASGEDTLADSWQDLWLTMLCPTLLLVLGPLIARLVARRERTRRAEAVSGADGLDQPLE